MEKPSVFNVRLLSLGINAALSPHSDICVKAALTVQYWQQQGSVCFSVYNTISPD